MFPMVNLDDSSKDQMLATKDVYLIGEPETPRMWVKIGLNGKTIRGLIDTGAQKSLLHESLVHKFFGTCPNLVESTTLVKGVGESVGVKVVGELTGKVDIKGMKLVDMSLMIMPLSMNMSSPLILGMDFLRQNNFMVEPGGRILCNRFPDGSWADWMIDSDGNPLELRLNRSKCVLTTSVEVQPGESARADIILADSKLRDYSGQLPSSQIFLVETGFGPSFDNMEVPDGLVSPGRMGVLLKNSGSTVRKLPIGTVVAVATTVLEVENEEILESWDAVELHEQVKLNHLSSEQQHAVLDMLGEVSQVFSKGEYDVQAATLAPHKIRLSNNTPVYQKARRLPEPISQEIERQCEELEAADIIERSVSPWSAPVVPIRKGDGNIRLCIDYRRLNAQTEPDRSPIPCLSDAVYSINNRKFFTSLDLVKGYYQLLLSPESRELTAFSTAYSHFQFKRLSFGLRNAPATFQKEIQNVLSRFPKKNVIVYFDDILIMEDSFEAHLELVTRVLYTLARHGMKVKPSKCQWFAKEVDFLGHTISSSGLRKQSSYIEKVDEFPLPQTVRELQQFLGLVNFQRKFIKDISLIQKPLSELTGGRKNAKIEWTEERRQAFMEIKAGMKRDIELAFPCYDEGAHKLILWVDASDGGAGACLMQRQEEEERVIAYASMTFSKAQKRYATVDKELAALRWAVKSFKSFLYGVEFIIRTDHQPLVYLHSMRVVDNRLARTLSDLSEFNFSIEYVPGPTNTAADTLSRIFVHPNNEEVRECPSELPVGLELDGNASAGGGDSLFTCLHRWLLSNCETYSLKSVRELRKRLMDELLKNPGKYGVTSPSKQWRRDMALRSLPQQLPPVEIMLVCSFFYKVKLEVFYWSGDPVTFVDWRIQPQSAISLQCLGGIHYNLLKHSVAGNMLHKPVYYCVEPPLRPVSKINIEVNQAETESAASCECPMSSHPCISVGVGEDEFCAVLDTGAEISLVRRDVFDKLAALTPLTLDINQVVYIEGYSGLVSSMAGGVDIELVLPNGMQGKPHTFAVVDNHLISQCFLLGIDYLTANSLAIDASEDCVMQVRPHLIIEKLRPYRVASNLCSVTQVRDPDRSVERTVVEEPLTVTKEPLPTGVSRLLDEVSIEYTQQNDPVIAQLTEYVLSLSPRESWPSELWVYRDSTCEYKIRDGILLCRVGEYETVVVPWNLLVRMVLSLHLALAHIGRDKMLHLIRQHIFHPNLYMAVRDVCQSCSGCQVMKASRQIHLPPTLKVVTSAPFELVAADVVLFPKTPDGFIGCIIVVDHNSKWVSAVPIKNKTSKAMVNAVKNQVLPYLPRCPGKMLTDNGSEFISKEFNKMLGEFGIQHVYSTPYRPQSNGCIERVNRTIGSFLRSLDSSSDWATKLPLAVIVYNGTLHQSLKMSPGAYLLGKAHLTADLSIVGDEVREFWSCGHPKFNPFDVGQSVIRKTPVKGNMTIAKFQAKYDGPYKVIKVNPNQLTYVLEKRDQTGLIRVHHAQLSPWIDPPSYLLPFLETAPCPLGDWVEVDSQESDDPSGLGGTGVLAFSTESETESMESDTSGLSHHSCLDALSRYVPSPLVDACFSESNGTECIFYDIPARDKTSIVLNASAGSLGVRLMMQDSPIFSELMEPTPSDPVDIFQDLPRGKCSQPAASRSANSAGIASEYAGISNPVGSVCTEGEGEVQESLFFDLLENDNPVSKVSVGQSANSSGFAGFDETPDCRNLVNEYLLQFDPCVRGDENRRSAEEIDAQLSRIRRSSSPFGSDSSVHDEPVISDHQLSSIVDWEMPLQECEDGAGPEATLSSGFIHDANTNAENMKRALQDLADSMDNLCEEYLESESSEACQSVASVPSVSRRTPVISSEVLSRMRTRSCGPAEDFPHVLKQPLERKKR